MMMTQSKHIARTSAPLNVKSGGNERQKERKWYTTKHSIVLLNHARWKDVRCGAVGGVKNTMGNVPVDMPPPSTYESDCVSFLWKFYVMYTLWY